MARLSVIEREKKRIRLVLKYAKKRSELKTQLKNPNLSIEDKTLLRTKLQKLPLNLGINISPNGKICRGMKNGRQKCYVFYV